MVFTNQFALSLELTRLLPLFGRATNSAADAIMRQARDLRHAGSDIVVEEDLANVLGRSRISLTLSSSFRTVITKSATNIPLVERITLQGGPGPTVIRALQESSYFSTVVQLSLLVWTFDAQHLATAIADALRNRLEGAPTSSVLQSSPDRVGILKVLNACESQTSAFNWNMMLDAVSRTLGYSPGTAPLDFPPFMLQALLDMLPMVQTLPNDRMLHIQVPVGEDLQSGISTLVVWAHHVLDLTVLVRSQGINGQLPNVIRFGNSDSEQVVIEEIAQDQEATIVLLDSRREHLLAVKPDPDSEWDTLIGSVKRTFARGWGTTILLDCLRDLKYLQTQSQAVLEDLQIVSSAFAFIMAKHLIRDDTDRYHKKDMAKKGKVTAHEVDEQRLLLATKFLFDNSCISKGAIDRFVALYSSQALDNDLPRPPALEAALRANLELDDFVFAFEWERLTDCAKLLGIFLIALAHVVNLEDCEDLMFAGFGFESMHEHPLAQQLKNWNGQNTLRIGDDAWLQAVAVPLLGHRGSVWDFDWNKVCLVSDRGWSAWITTFGDLDPAFIGAGSVRLGRGSPCRNGVWKSGIIDTSSEFFDVKTPLRRAESYGQVTSLRCSKKVTMESPYCGEGDDYFLVSAGLRVHGAGLNQKPVHRVGYKALQRSLWWARLSKACSHGSQMHKEIKLGIDCATVKGFGNYLNDTEERILIYLTAHSVGARWLALATIQHIGVIMYDREARGARQMLLRSIDCCFQCAIDQAAAQPGKWFIIL